jgi:phosphoribosylformylglycinamidine cyclo-ligase
VKPKSYSEAGVSIDKGDSFARFIASLNSPAISPGIGGFAGGIELDLKGIESPVMLSSTDGVGTKLLVAQKLKKFDTLGIDLVAMCVNDLIVAGVKPQIFLDYISCGHLDDELLQALMTGIVAGCEQAGCTLAGGETAEMPDLYGSGDFDLAGFCVGVGDKSALLPRHDEIRVGDKLLALPSTGIHSNGLSLARKVLDERNNEAWQALLTPTKICVDELSFLLETGAIKAAAHITGGGIEGNVARVIPNGIKASFSWDWPVPDIFLTLENDGGIPEAEMRRVFNMGLGIVMVVSREQAETLKERAASREIAILEVGELISG